MFQTNAPKRKTTKLMRKAYKEALKTFLTEQIKNSRISHHLSQEKAAEYLAMDPRSYADIDNGKCMCSTTTFALFLTYLCDDPNELLNNVKIIIEEIYKIGYKC